IEGPDGPLASVPPPWRLRLWGVAGTQLAMRGSAALAEDLLRAVLSRRPVMDEATEEPAELARFMAASRSNLGNLLRSHADGETGGDARGRERGELYQEAEELYREAMALDPRHAPSRSNLGNLLRSHAD